MSESDRPDPAAVAHDFLVEHYSEGEAVAIGGIKCALRWWRGEYFAYDRGYYRRLPDGELKATLTGYLRDSGVRVSTHFVNSVLLCINAVCMIEGRVEPGSWLGGINGAEVVVAGNGNISFTDIDKETGKRKLLRHTPDFFSLTKLPYAYDPEAECPLWEAFISDVMSNDPEYVTLLRQWCGYLFRRDLREHRFLLMVGEGSNGKGVFCDVVESLVGPDNVSHVPLARFGQSFSLYSTIGKMVNISSESSHLVEDNAETLLKSFVAGDTMLFERKYRDAIDARPTAKVMIATNALPRFNDKTFGLWRRVLLVPFRQTFEAARQIKTLAQELKRELPGILNWALEGLESLTSNNGFSIPAAHEREIDEYRRDADPCRAFLLDHYEPTPNGDFVITDEAYATYKAWCDVNGCRPMNERTFGQQVRRVFPNVERTRPRQGAERFYAYRGIRSQESSLGPKGPM